MRQVSQSNYISASLNVVRAAGSILFHHPYRSLRSAGLHKPEASHSERQA